MKFSIIALLGLLSATAFGRTCEYGVCKGQTVFFENLLLSAKVTGFYSGSDNDVKLSGNHGSYADPSQLYRKFGSRHIGMSYKVRNGNARYKILATNLWNNDKLIGKLSTTGGTHVVYLSELDLSSGRPATSSSSARWKNSSSLDRTTGVVKSIASVKSSTGRTKLEFSCTTVDYEPLFAIQIPKVIGRAALFTKNSMNEDIKVTLSTTGKNSQTFASTDYAVVNQNLIVKADVMPADIIESLASGNTLSLKIEGEGDGTATTTLSKSKFSLKGSRKALTKMQDICDGIIN